MQKVCQFDQQESHGDHFFNPLDKHILILYRNPMESEPSKTLHINPGINTNKTRTQHNFNDLFLSLFQIALNNLNPYTGKSIKINNVMRSNAKNN